MALMGYNNGPKGGLWGDYTSLRDMFDGGGAGQSGQKFEGGLFSGLMNTLGVRPVGFEDRLAEAKPQARPVQPQRRYVRPAEPVAQPVTQQPLIGGMTAGDITAAIDRGQPQLPSTYEMLAMDMQRRNAYGPMFKPGMSTPPTLPPFWQR